MDLVVLGKWESRIKKTCNKAGVGTCSCDEILVKIRSKSGDMRSTYVVESNF